MPPHQAGPDQLIDQRPIVTRHDFDLRFGFVQGQQRSQLSEYRRAILVDRELGDESRTLALQLDVPEMPGHVPNEKKLSTIVRSNIDHLTSRRVSGGLDEHHPGGYREVLRVVEWHIAIERVIREFWRPFRARLQPAL